MNKQEKKKEYKELQLIQKIVCNRLNINEDWINTKNRKREIVECRQIIYYLIKDIYNYEYSFSEIGAEIGGKNHATVIYGVKVCKERLSYDKKFVSLIESLKEESIITLEKLEKDISNKSPLIELRNKAKELIRRSNANDVSISFNLKNYTRINHLTAEPIRLYNNLHTKSYDRAGQ